MAVEDLPLIMIRGGVLVGIVGFSTIGAYYASRRIPNRLRNSLRIALAAISLMYVGIFTYWTFLFEAIHYGKSLLDAIPYGVVTGNFMYLVTSVAALITLQVAVGKGAPKVPKPKPPEAQKLESPETTIACTTGLPQPVIFNGEEMVGVLTYVPKAELTGVLETMVENALKEHLTKLHPLKPEPEQIEATIQTTSQAAETGPVLIRRVP